MEFFDIQLRYLPYPSAYTQLSKLLEGSTLTSKNWKHLAEYFKKTMHDIMFISDTAKDKSCTERLILDLSNDASITIGKLRNALEEIERHDAVEVLDTFKDKAEDLYMSEQQKLQQYNRSGEENSFSWGSVEHSKCTSYVSYAQHHPCQHVQNCAMNLVRPQGLQRQNSHHMPPDHQSHYVRYSQRPNGPLPYPVPDPSMCRLHSVPVYASESDSMMVHMDNRHMDDINMADSSPDSFNEERGMMGDYSYPAPLPGAIMRGENQLTSFNGETFMGGQGGLDVGRVEEVTTSDNNAQFISLHGRVGCQGYFPPATNMLGSPRPDELIIKKTVRNSQMAHTSPSGHLQKLQELSRLPYAYQPNQEYKNIVADQKVDERSRNGPQSSGHTENSKANCSGGGNKRLIVNNKDQSSTFPRRGSSKASSSSSSDDDNRTNSLTKSVSLPVNMKPAEYRRTFKHIVVFVTYSNDDKHHLRRVLSLCNCLVKNGFSCCVDINNGFVASLPNHDDRENWCQKKFSEADFVLVCPSKKYKEMIIGTSTNNGVPRAKRLHEREIFQLMQHDYQRVGRNTRFVPVLFEGQSKDFLPSWLQDVLSYSWPVQYKDLLWMLTKPEDRIKPKPKLFSQSMSQSNSSSMETESSDANS